MFQSYQKTINYIEKNKLLDGKTSVLAAVSGGADSMCMLDILFRYAKEKDIRLGAVTVNHGFRIEAADEAKYVEEFCKQRNIPFFLKEIKPGDCKNSEEAARLYRYRLLEETAKDNQYDVIALAHNANDRAETLLFNIFRGTGLKGMTSIRPLRDRFIRPVLGISRDEIEAYLSENQIKYFTDGSNLKDDYSRNKIRHHIIPVSEEINSESIAHMNEIAQIMCRIDGYLSEQIENEYKKSVIQTNDGVRISVNDFVNLNEYIQSELVRKMITDMTPHLKDITINHIDSIVNLGYRDSNGSVDLPYGIRAYREYGDIFITNSESNDDSQDISYEITPQVLPKSCELPNGQILNYRLLDADSFGDDLQENIPRNKYTKWFDYDKISSSICIRSYNSGDEIAIGANGQHKSISRYMIETKIPARIRKNVMVLASDDDILWVVGYRDSYSYRVDEKTKVILEVSLEE